VPVPFTNERRRTKLDEWRTQMKRFTITVTMDRPVGYQDAYGNRYPINYGYVAGLFAGDNEEQDVYILDIDKPLKTFTGEIVAIIHRKDDVEDKWVAAASGQRVTKEEIWVQVKFIEQYFDSTIELLPY
jgi:inorganic pyrophosphatase